MQRLNYQQKTWLAANGPLLDLIKNLGSKADLKNMLNHDKTYLSLFKK